MIIVPIDVKCRFCRNISCCRECRIKHEDKAHSDEIAKMKEEELLIDNCYICQGQKLPFGGGFDEFSPQMLQHIVDSHFPLSCDRCDQIFQTIEDLKCVGKCCKTVKMEVTVEDEPVEKENVVEIDKLIDIDCEKSHGKPLTPLASINMRWRRKSVEIMKIENHLQVVQEKNLARQTSTPTLQGKLLTTKHFTESSTFSASSIHLSSINYTSSTSSESDAFSPPMPEPQKPLMVQPLSPQRIQKPPNQSRSSRSKKPVQATPLRQVMTRSIQRAIKEHGHYRQTPYSQRKMSFNSTGSSHSGGSSLMKMAGDSPLDLRLSPALRRTSNPTEQEKKSAADSSDLIDLREQVEQRLSIEEIVIIRRREIKSETSAGSSNYKSVLSDTAQSGSMPEIHATPKIVGHNFLKKTISFVTPETIEKSPTLLTTVVDDDDDDDADDVFYTPRASPKKFPRTFRTPPEPSMPGHSSCVDKKPGESKSNLWKMMTSVMYLGGSKKGEDISDSVSSTDGSKFKFSFKKPDFVQKAADFFTKRSESSCDEQPNKRRRTSSNADNRMASPLMKRQRIQSRKPIDRMKRRN